VIITERGSGDRCGEPVRRGYEEILPGDVAVILAVTIAVTSGPTIARMADLVRIQPGPERQVFSAAEVARILGISERSVYDWVARGDIRVVPNRGRRVLVPKREIERLLNCEAAS
jgi:excisionase family DNA binding protein